MSMRQARNTLNALSILAATLLVAACSQSFGVDGEKEGKYNTTKTLPRFEDRTAMKEDMTEDTQEKYPVPTREELKAKLTPEQFNVVVKQGTEPAFTHEYNDVKDKGMFNCVACGLPLFDSETKFNSGTGWPSFYQPVNTENVGEVTDNTYGMRRTEVVCNNCGAHLGHVFNDGPDPTGLRYCINGASLNFEKEDL